MQHTTRIYHPEKDKKIKIFHSYNEIIQHFQFTYNLEVYPSNQPILDPSNKNNFFIETQREAAWRLLSQIKSPANCFVGSVASLSAYLWSKGKHIDATWIKNMNDLNEGTMRNFKENCHYVIDLTTNQLSANEELILKPSFSAIVQYEALLAKPTHQTDPTRPRALHFIRHGFAPIDRIFIQETDKQFAEGTIYKKLTQFNQTRTRLEDTEPINK